MKDFRYRIGSFCFEHFNYEEIPKFNKKLWSIRGNNFKSIYLYGFKITIPMPTLRKEVYLSHGLGYKKTLYSKLVRF